MDPRADQLLIILLIQGLSILQSMPLRIDGMAGIRMRGPRMSRLALLLLPPGLSHPISPQPTQVSNKPQAPVEFNIPKP